MGLFRKADTRKMPGTMTAEITEAASSAVPAQEGDARSADVDAAENTGNPGNAAAYEAGGMGGEEDDAGETVISSGTGEDMEDMEDGDGFGGDDGDGTEAEREGNPGRILTFRGSDGAENAGAPAWKPRLEFTGMYVISDSMRVIGEIQLPQEPAGQEEGPRQETIVQAGDGVRKASGLVSRQDVLGILNGAGQMDIEGEMPEWIERKWLDGKIRMLPGWKVPETCSPGEPGACRNETELSGKIIAKRRRSDGGMAFILACGFRGMKRDRENRPIKDIITLAFTKEQMRQYGDFGVGDRIMAGGVLQNVVDRKHPFKKPGSSVIFYPVSTVCMGLWMTHGERRNIGRYDYNAARIVGPVVEAHAILDGEGKPNGWIAARVRTTVRRVTPGYVDGRYDRTREYSNRTYVRVFVGEDDAERVAANTLTPGTWVDVNGHIFGRIKSTEEEARNGKFGEDR